MQTRLTTGTALPEQDEQPVWYGKDIVNSHTTSKHVNSDFLCFPGAFDTVF